MKVVTALVVLGFLTAACSGTSTKADKPTLPVLHIPRSGPVNVTYFLDGHAQGANITYETPSGQEQQTGVAVPLFTKAGGEGLNFIFERGAFLYFSAQNTGSGGFVTCSIYEGGQVLSKNTAHGAYAIATCQASA